MKSPDNSFCVLTVTMIMCTLLSMVYGLFKTCWLTHVTCTFLKETVLLFNVHLICFVDFILSYAQLTNICSKVCNKKVRLFCWICWKLKINTSWHSSAVFIVDFDHSQHVNIVFLLLTLNKYLSVRCERQVIMFWKHKKRIICFVINVRLKKKQALLKKQPLPLVTKN